MRCAGNKGRIGTIMVTPPKLPANDSVPPLMRAVVLSSGLFAFCRVSECCFRRRDPAPRRPGGKDATKPEPALTAENAVELCRSLFEEPKEYMDHEAKRRRWDLRAASCKMASEADPANLEFKVAVARNLPYERKTGAIADAARGRCAG